MVLSFGNSLKRKTSSGGALKHARSHSDASHNSGYDEHDDSHAEHARHKPLPFLASPVDPQALKWVAKKKRSGGLEKATSVAQFDAERTESALAQRIFRKQHEASTLELFFDLFFVGNLAVFTTKSAHMDLQSLSNYLGFFAILWTTWFHISMYDVRFYVDCVFTRICKFLSFGIMVSLVSLGSLYDAILSDGKTRAFHGVAILMFATRILWVVQYATVLYFVRVFDKTLVPMCLTMMVYFTTSMVFLATWIRDRKTEFVSSADGVPEVRIWYGVICFEACAIIAIAIFWRILSFKHTHLVERVGLLSLIIMGEGIIGLVKSTSYTIQGTSISIWQESLIVAAAILLIYLIYILYFDNVDHHGFGTIGQQIWTLLHFPTHVAILLTVEASTALLIWNPCRMAVVFLNKQLPSVTDPKGTFTNNDKFIAQVNSTWGEMQARYKYKSLEDYYPYIDFSAAVAKLQKPNATFGSSDWSKEAGKSLQKMSDYFQYFIYQNFGAEGPVYKLKKEKDYGKKVAIYEEGYRFVMIYFYISAGALLLLLAALFMIGKKRKTATNWWSIAIRVFAGLCIPLGIISPLLEKPGTENSLRFYAPFALIPIVTVGYFLVIIVDNIAKAISERHYTLIEERRLSRITIYDTEAVRKAAYQEEREIGEEEASYELTRNTTHNSRPYEHNLPQVVQDHDRAGLIQNAQGQGVATSTGYSRVGQEEQEYPEYGYHEESQQARRF